MSDVNGLINTARAGFTEAVNIVPNGWSWKKVNEFTLEHKQGYYTKESYTGEGSYLIRITDLNNPKVNYSNMPKLYISEKEFSQFQVSVGDFLFARSGAIGRYGIITEEYPAVFASYLIRFRFDNEAVSTRYFGYAYESDICQKQLGAITQGSSNININADNIKSLSVPFPPILEQQKIAQILTSVDEVIEKTQAQIDKLKDLKTGMIQELLTKGIGHTEFKDSTVGMIPAEWKIVPISELCSDVVDCVNKTAQVVDYKTPFKMIRTTNVRHGRVDTENVRYVAQETYETWTRRMRPENGDLIFTREAPVGECGVLEDSRGVFLGQRTMMYRANEQLTSSRFLMYSLMSNYGKQQLDDFSGGSTVAHMRIPDCNKILIKTPPIEEQNKIVNSINSIDVSIQKKESKLEKTMNTKKALMQDLLTGKVRVNT
jgi:type I restriction enzyme S subunit